MGPLIRWFAWNDKKNVNVNMLFVGWFFFFTILFNDKSKSTMFLVERRIQSYIDDGSKQVGKL